MSLNKPSLISESLQVFAAKEFFETGVVVNGIRFRVAALADLDHLLAAEKNSWGAGTESEKKIAFSKVDIESQLKDFPGLQVLALKEQDEKEVDAVGWACLIRVPRTTNIYRVPDSEETYHQRINGGERFEAMGVAVAKGWRGQGIGRNLMISRQAAVAQTIVTEALEKYGNSEKVLTHLDEIMAQTSSTASIRLPGYGAWLKAQGLNQDALGLRQAYLDAVKTGAQRDSVLNTNLAVIDETQGLTGILSLEGGCYADEDSMGAGLRGESTALVREYARLILERV